MESWKVKAHAIIYAMANESYRAANYLPNGRKRKKHVPYSVPADATMLERCLNTDDEETAKAYFQERAIFGEGYRKLQ